MKEAPVELHPRHAFDVDSLVDATEAHVEVRDPRSDRPTGWVIRLAGPEHPLRKAKEWERAKQIRARMFAEGRYVPDIEDEVNARTELLVACTLGWVGAERKGELLECTPGNVREIYSSPRWQWVRRQVSEALDKRELFIEHSG